MLHHSLAHFCAMATISNRGEYHKDLSRGRHVGGKILKKENSFKKILSSPQKCSNNVVKQSTYLLTNVFLICSFNFLCMVKLINFTSILFSWENQKLSFFYNKNGPDCTKLLASSRTSIDMDGTLKFPITRQGVLKNPHSFTETQYFF